MLLKMSTEKKKDTCVGQKGKNGKRKGDKKKEKEEKEEDREMILGEEHWKRWQERNKTPFVSFPDWVNCFWIEERWKMKTTVFPLHVRTPF